MSEPGAHDAQSVPPQPPPAPNAGAPGAYPPPPPVAWEPAQPSSPPAAWDRAAAAPTAWPGGESPGSRRSMVILTVAVLALVGIAGAWATVNREVRPDATPTATARVAGSGAPVRPGTARGDHLGSAADQAALAKLVPSSVSARCEPTTVTDPQLAAVTCTTSDGYVVAYETYPTRNALDQGWRIMLYEQDLAADDGACKTGRSGEAGWYYTDGNPDNDEGRDACFMADAGPVLVWTDYTTRTRAWLYGPRGTTVEETFNRWNEGNLDPIR